MDALTGTSQWFSDSLNSFRSCSYQSRGINMNIGVLGIGVIGSAIVKGFCLNGDSEHQLYISPRGENTGLELAKQYPQVTRCQTNQEVLDRSDLVIIALLPQKGMEILTEVKFKKTHQVVNLMSDKKLDAIKAVIGETKSLIHMVPLSFISKREGPIAIYPEDESIIRIFEKMGHIVAVNEVEKIEAIAAITGLMTSYYRLMNDIVNWGTDHHLSRQEATDYTGRFFEALAKHGTSEGLATLATEMTRGGLNEMGLKAIESENGFKLWTTVLDPMLKKVKGTS